MFLCKPIMPNTLILITCVISIWIHPVYTGYEWNDPKQIVQHFGRKNMTEGPSTATNVLPQFDMNQITQISVYEGQMAYLPCIVHNLGDRVVSWIRTKDLHILTSDIHQFTGDTRFDIIHHPESENWTLQINNTRTTDSGFYECQVNTDPKIKFPVTLTVIDSNQLHDSPYHNSESSRATTSNGRIARISGPYEQYVQEGSTVTFTCEVSPVGDKHFISDSSYILPSSTINKHNNNIRGSEENERHVESTSSSSVSLVSSSALIYPTHAPIEWTHRGRLVSFQAARGGISLDTDYRAQVSASRLTISMVTVNDSGEYQCSQGDAIPATIFLLIEDAEQSEAMQRDMAAVFNHGNTFQISIGFIILFPLYSIL